MTAPGVSLRAACFAHGVYDSDPAATCLSNLLVSGYRRFLLDIYWDVERSTWNLCPAQVPDIAGSGNGDASIALATATSDVDVATVNVSERQVETRTSAPPSSVSSSPTSLSSSITTSGSLGPSSALNTANSTSISVSATVAAPQSQHGDGTLLQIGQYQCSTGLDLLFLMEVLSDFLFKTQNTVDAYIVYLTLNLHAAAPANDSIGPAQQPPDSDLPSPNNLISNIMNTNLSSYIYTPSHLRHDREDLNGSWYDVTYQTQPDSRYYGTSEARNHVFTTSDGWPSESYVEFQQEQRLLVEFGNVDPQMQNYNFSGDDGTIFPKNYIWKPHNVTFSPNGTLSQGCFYEPAAVTPMPVNNNSWSENFITPAELQASSVDVANATVYTSVNNLTSCGISPFLNQTLSNTTADKNFSAYQGVPFSSIWSWTAGEPRNVSADENNDQEIRCAVMDIELQGQWRIDDCNNHHFSACRIDGLPYLWAIADQKGSYSSSAEAGCGDNQSFSAPRTGLENTYLFNAWKDAHDDKDGDTALWVDFNSLDQEHCWVVGINASCPYTDHNDSTQARQVIAPTVAGVIIFVLAALTLFVKCAANRQSSKRRRRRKGEDGWDYEGVPS